MRKVIITIAVLMAAIGMSAQDNKAYKREGNTFIQVSKATPSQDDQVTSYKWRDSQGNEYPIILHTYTKGEKAGKTTCYVIRTSQKGNEYKYYLPQGEQIAEELIKENQ